MNSLINFNTQKRSRSLRFPQVHQSNLYNTVQQTSRVYRAFNSPSKQSNQNKIKKRQLMHMSQDMTPMPLELDLANDRLKGSIEFHYRMEQDQKDQETYNPKVPSTTRNNYDYQLVSS